MNLSRPHTTPSGRASFGTANQDADRNALVQAAAAHGLNVAEIKALLDDIANPLRMTDAFTHVGGTDNQGVIWFVEVKSGNWQNESRMTFEQWRDSYRERQVRETTEAQRLS